MTDFSHYAIRGGVEGRERLRVLGRVMRASTAALLDRLGLVDGLSCLEVGCGGGDATLELARRVAPNGKVVGVDLDPIPLESAREEAQRQGVVNVEFIAADGCGHEHEAKFDLVYARFLLTHLSDPAGAVGSFYRSVRPGGIVAVEDIDFSGYFTYPESAAFRRYHALYCEVVRRRGGDPNIGLRLPILLIDGGFEHVDVSVVQPVGIRGDVKLMNPITMECVADAILRDGLASRQEIDSLVQELSDFATDPRTVAGLPRVVQAWGHRPGA
jgi:SAM-dependent methyltransferase